MPILAIDSMGNYYETDPDSSEGDGCKGMVRTTQMGDMTLDKSILRAENARQRSRASEKAGFAALDQRDEQIRRSEHALAVVKRAQNERQAFAMNTPAYKQKMLLAGLEQSRRDNYNTDANIGLSGNGMTANGLSGRYGKDKHQRGAEIALGMGNNYDAPCAPNTDYNNPDAANTPCSVTEQQQYWLCKRVEQQLATDAMNKTRMNILIDQSNGGGGDGSEAVADQSQNVADGGDGDGNSSEGSGNDDYSYNANGNSIPAADVPEADTVQTMAITVAPPPPMVQTAHPMFALFYSKVGA